LFINLAGRLPNMYRSSDDEELTEIAGQSVPKDDIIKEAGGYSGSNSSDESDSNGIAIPGAPRLRLLGKDNSIVYRKTLRLSSDQIVRSSWIFDQVVDFVVCVSGKSAIERGC
jgi:hypothetical protein